MTKIKIEELGCFNEVASVIGVVGAKKELFRVANSKNTTIHSTNLSLLEAFDWETSPQGLDFWNLIDDGIHPKANP